MFKRHIVKLFLSLTVLASLLGGGAALSASAAAAHVAPTNHSLACGLIIYPPC